MRTRSILTTAGAMLLASTILAAAQGMQKHAPGGAGEGAGAPAQIEHEGQGKQPAQKSNRREESQRKAGQMEEREGGAPKGKQDKQQPQKQQTQKEQRGKQETTQDGSHATDAKSKTGERKGGEKGEQHNAGSEHKTLTTEQKTRVRERVLHGGNAPRVAKLNFSINVGTVVPRSVKVVALPPVLVEYYPAYRGYLYFVADEEIIIVDRNYRIIAVIAV